MLALHFISFPPHPHPNNSSKYTLEIKNVIKGNIAALWSLFFHKRSICFLCLQNHVSLVLYLLSTKKLLFFFLLRVGENEN